MFTELYLKQNSFYSFVQIPDTPFIQIHFNNVDVSELLFYCPLRVRGTMSMYEDLISGTERIWFFT